MFQCLEHLQQSDVTFSVFHVNDIHAHFEEVDVYTGRCRDDQAAAGDCYGGMARMYTKMRELQQQEENWIFLNAGDYYQGTIWYTKFNYEPVAYFAKMLNYTAMGIGNHDFDDAIEGLIPFAADVNFPLLAANMYEDGPEVLTPYYKKSIVQDVAGLL